MNVSPDTMRLLLIATLVGMALLAALYLRRRELRTAQYLSWGLLALLVPLLGPFLVILNHPGRLREQFRHPPRRRLTPTSRVSVTARRLHTWLTRLHQ